MPEFLSALRRRIRLIRWQLGTSECACGETMLPPNTTMERAGVKHRTDGPCFRCDGYGNPL
jgi:hypothetical protein